MVVNHFKQVHSMNTISNIISHNALLQQLYETNSPIRSLNPKLLNKQQTNPSFQLM